MSNNGEAPPNPADFSDSDKSFLSSEAAHIRSVSQRDPWLAISTSKVDPLPHQIEAVYHTVLKNTQIRFLLGHESGSGKTTMAALIIKEMKLQGSVNRVLIITTFNVEHWQHELKKVISY